MFSIFNAKFLLIPQCSVGYRNFIVRITFFLNKAGLPHPIPARFYFYVSPNRMFKGKNAFPKGVCSIE
jgi:hypothetical protein